MDRRSPVIFLLTSLLVMWGAGCSKEEKNPHLENVLLEQLLVKAVATEEGFEKCGKQARKVLDDLRSGADFAETAIKYSSHPSAVRGGELVLTQGWMDPLLEKTAFAMADSSLSDIIRTPEALYIIYRNYGEYLQMRSSHILIKSSGPNKLDTTRTRTDKEAIQICRELRKRLEQGESFFELAREYSEDPGSAQNGGDIGWTKRNSLDRGYEKVAFLQEPGQISQPVETRFGWHLIRTVKKKDLSARIRLIRFEMPVDEQDRRKALKAIQEARRQAVAGVELKDLAERFTIHPDGVFKYNKPYMVRKNMLVPDLAARFAKMSPGEITEVMENDAGYYFIKLIEK